MESLNAFDDLLAEVFIPFIDLSNQVGGLVQQQVQLVNESIQAQRAFIEYASRSAKPSTNVDLMNLLKPTADLICKVQDIREKNRKHDQFNQLSAISEGIAALGWVTISPTPAPYVKEMADSAQFYTNKVLVAFKDKQDQAHQVNWAKAWINFLHSLQQYIRKLHTTGLVWAIAAPTCGGPPPPPPPPMLDLNLGSMQTGNKAMDDARAALFASINKGADVTRGLRKVNPDEMTHKNPTLRAGSSVPANQMQNLSLGGGCKNTVKGPEKFELDGKKWMIENMSGRRDLMISETQMTQSINIYRCDDCVLIVKGKVNSITIDNCRKFSIAFDSIVSVVELINSRSIQAQAMEVVPTVTVDCVDGVELYLSPKSLNVEIVSSKSSSINVSVTDSTGDYVEHPLPEQYKSTWDGKSFKTVAIDKN